ncbi:MAG: hypothetical protein F6K14_08870 [Symploca sp. SIO2C1]|nr:hypothetical protein [Symploca sp. SIO2C1]
MSMEYICTTCSKNKRKDKILLPATQRYISKRIKFVFNESRKLNKPFIILSGRYGLIDSEFKIPWYDQKLIPENVELLIPIVTKQLREKEVSKIMFYGKPRTIPDWKPYYDALEQSCNQLGISITYKQVEENL